MASTYRPAKAGDQIMLATHPRSASTAFERSFMTRKDLNTAHEPYGDPFYFGPEHISDRYPQEQRNDSQYKDLTYRKVYDDLRAQAKDKPLFIKDMAQYWIPPTGTASIAPSMADKDNGSHANGSSESKTGGNLAVLPKSALDSYRYIFLIRAPHLSIASYYKCCIPPQNKKTGFDHYRHEEAGYRELRMLYDYVVATTGRPPVVVESSDLAVDPKQILERACESVGLPFDPNMLSWGEDADVTETFARWNGFHDDVLKSTGFRIKPEAKPSSDNFVIDYDQWQKDWATKFDAAGVKAIRDSVEKSLDDYLYLRSKRLILNSSQ